MIFDPRVVAERKRMEPIYFFIRKFIKENNLTYCQLMTVFERNFRHFDQDEDELLNREEFQFFIRQWAKTGFNFDRYYPEFVRGIRGSSRGKPGKILNDVNLT